MGKIYIVTEGSYSDYHIVGTFSTKEKAEEHSLLVLGEERQFYDAKVEEWDIDEIVDHPKGMFFYNVVMTKDGKTQECKNVGCEYKNTDAPYGDNANFSFYMWARDEKHAIKIANERRTQLIALNQWTTDWDAWKERKKNEHDS